MHDEAAAFGARHGPSDKQHWRSASMRTICSFCAVRFYRTQWPDMRLPGKTRPGSCAMPMEPGTFVGTRITVTSTVRREVVALDNARETLADGRAGDVHQLTDLEYVYTDLPQP